MNTLEALSELLGAKLGLFKIEKVFDVWSQNEDGRKSANLGTFRNEVVAKAFAGNETNNYGTQIDEVFVLTDGIKSFLIDTSREIKFINDEEEAVKLREKALAKLSPEDKALLGLK